MYTVYVTRDDLGSLLCGSSLDELGGDVTVVDAATSARPAWVRSTPVLHDLITDATWKGQECVVRLQYLALASAFRRGQAEAARAAPAAPAPRAAKVAKAERKPLSPVEGAPEAEGMDGLFAMGEDADEDAEENAEGDVANEKLKSEDLMRMVRQREEADATKRV